MRWVWIASVVVAATYVGTFYYTESTWAATNVAGIISLFYVLAFIYNLTRPPMPSKQKRWVLSIATVVVAGTTFYWTVMYTMTNWQAETLHTIHKVIVHGISVDLLRERGLKLLRSYALQSEPQKLSLGGIFRKETRYANPDSSIIESPWDQYRLFAASVTDTQVVFVCQAIIRVDGERSDFRNFDGRNGMVQDRLVVSKRGMVYEIQN